MEHLLHTWPTGGAFVTDDYDFAGLNLAGQDHGHGLFLGIDDAGGTREFPQVLVHTCGL